MASACGLFAVAGIHAAPHVVWFLLLILSTAATTVVTTAKMMLRRPLKTTVAVFLCIFIVFLLSGFNLEGNVDTATGKQTQVPANEDPWVLAVEAEKRAIEEMAFVKEVRFNYGHTANLCKVFATVWCCWDSGSRKLKKVTVACTLDDERPTYLEALRVLREKLVQEHGAPDHTPHPKAVENRQLHEAAQPPEEPTPNENAFDRMKAAASRLYVAEQRAKADADALKQAAAAELAAAQRREAAQARAKASKAVFNELQENAPPQQKRQKATTDSPQQDIEDEAALEEDAAEANPEAWESYSLPIFRSLFRKFAHTSTVVVDESNTDQTFPPRGDETRGWRHHAQHGMYPHIRHWAEGSPFRVSFMLAELAQYFGVVDAVAERLNLKLTKEEVEQAKTDRYIVDRLVDAIQELKQCRSLEEWIDYCVVLAAVAPERADPGNPTGMIKKVSERLKVQRGSRYVKATGERRPRAFDQAISRRAAAFDVARLKGLGPGSAATSRGQPCTVVEIDREKDTCTLAFESGGIEVTRSYDCIYKGKDAPGKAKFPKGSARLRRVPPSLRPQVSSALTLGPHSHAHLTSHAHFTSHAHLTFWLAAGSCETLR